MANYNLAQFEAMLLGAGSRMELGNKKHMEEACRMLQKECRATLGHYQAGFGSFPAWEQLQDATQERRQRRGYPPNNPLAVTMALWHAIDFLVDHAGTGYVGVAHGAAGRGTRQDPARDIGIVAATMEMGSPSKGIPQRSFLGMPAAKHKMQIAMRYFGRSINTMFATSIIALPRL